MYPELPISRERKRTLLTTASNERLVSIANSTHNLKIIDYICEIMADRFEHDPSLENEMALARMLYRQDEILEISILKADYNVEADESIVLEEAVNEALFKPFGQ